MNERIKELTEQAMMNSLFEPIAPYFTIGTGDGKMDLPVVFVEKLAELIVKECAKIADDNFNKGFCPVGDYIKQHFGVE